MVFFIAGDVVYSVLFTPNQGSIIPPKYDMMTVTSCCTSQACHSTNLHLWLHACFIYTQLYIAAASHTERVPVFVLDEFSIWWL